MKCIIKDGEENVLVMEGDIEERWKSYFHMLFNEGHATLMGSYSRH